MAETIKATELPIRDIFSNSYSFEIPDYQRPYAWTVDEAGELLDDLLHATQDIRDVASVKDTLPYFMGSIVVIKKGDNPLAYVVDGQQRLTTLTIMLCALRELSTDDEYKTGLHKFIGVEADPVAGVEKHYRLAVRERDRIFFRKNIQDNKALGKFVTQKFADFPDSQQRMFENAERLWEILSELDEDRRNILTAFIGQRCFLVVVSTSDQESAYRIFAVMNDRGLDLSPTDILKAQIIGPMDKDDTKKYTEIWEDIEEEVGRDDFRQIFSHIRMIYTRSKLRRTLQQEFQDNVLKQLKGDNFINEVLVPYADAYEAITKKPNESYTDGKSMNESLRHLNRLDNFDWIAPAMAFFKKHWDDANALLAFIRNLERLAYGLFLMRANINVRINRYAEVLQAVKADADLSADSSPLQLKYEEKNSVVEALNGEIYDQNRISRVGKPLLLRLDSTFADAAAAYNHSIITIEHVLPQNPAQGSEWETNFSQEERREWTGKLANLALLSRRKNSEASNYDFERKKQKYFQNGNVPTFPLTTQILRASEWTPTVLKCRQKFLIDKMKEEWCLD